MWNKNLTCVVLLEKRRTTKMKSIQSHRGVKELAYALMKKRSAHPSPQPLKAQVHGFVDDVIEFLFPHLSEKVYFTSEEIQAKLVLLQRNLKSILEALPHKESIPINSVTSKFFVKLPEIHDRLWRDARAIDRGDPASESIEEVVLAYPGFIAIAIYRLAHELYLLHVPILPRVMTEYAHQMTGIDIHPGAAIGRSFFIDHGTGIVIGESARIGDHVKMYQGVTLGALSVNKKLAKRTRHPTIEDHVTIYAQAVILGGTTVVGHHSVIGGNVWLTRSVPPYSLVHTESTITVRKKSGGHKNKQRK
jgi:serine O-acetyltransferase